MKPSEPSKPQTLLISRTEGNPFFLEESVRTLVETRVLEGERGGYRLAKPIDSIEVPATVQAVLAARIDRLSPEEKRLLQSASVIGEDIPFTLLFCYCRTAGRGVASPPGSPSGSGISLRSQTISGS